MHHSDFLKQLDEEKIVAAIAAAERGTSGEIRIFISHKKRADALAFAQARFHKLGMHKTRHRNGVLIYLVPRSRSFAIVGDSGIHEKCGDDFWSEASRELGENLRTLPMTGALTRAVKKIGGLLALHFPSDPGGQDELPNAILHD